MSVTAIQESTIAMLKKREERSGAVVTVATFAGLALAGIRKTKPSAIYLIGPDAEKMRTLLTEPTHWLQTGLFVQEFAQNQECDSAREREVFIDLMNDHSWFSKERFALLQGVPIFTNQNPPKEVDFRFTGEALAGRGLSYIADQEKFQWQEGTVVSACSSS